jgi:hypothetical protein
VIITTEPKHYPDVDLQEVASRHDGATSALGTLARALDTIPLLCAEIGRLRVRLGACPVTDGSLMCANTKMVHRPVRGTALTMGKRSRVTGIVRRPSGRRR